MIKAKEIRIVEEVISYDVLPVAMFADFTDVRGLQHSGYGGITTMIFPHMLDWSVIPRSACVLSRNDSFKQWFFQWWFFHTYQIGTLYPDVLVFFQAMVLPPSYRASVQTMGKFMRTNKHFYLLLHSAISISEQSKNNRTKCDDPGYVAKLWRLLELDSPSCCFFWSGIQ